MYTMLNDGNSDNSSLQLSKTKGQYLLTCRASRCVFSFSTAEWMSSRLSRFGANGQTFLGLHMLHIHTDFEIFRQQIYFILIYLLQRPYFNIVVLKKEHSKMEYDCKTFADYPHCLDIRECWLYKVSGCNNTAALPELSKQIPPFAQYRISSGNSGRR